MLSYNGKDKNKLTVNNYVNSVNGPKNKINTSKILNEESIQDITILSFIFIIFFFVFFDFITKK